MALKFSIVIPTYNEAGGIERLLRALNGIFVQHSLDGEVIVSKSYPSSYRVPDDLHGGEMSMVNQTIDLMEKENVDPPSLARIREQAGKLK